MKTTNPDLQTIIDEVNKMPPEKALMHLQITTALMEMIKPGQVAIMFPRLILELAAAQARIDELEAQLTLRPVTSHAE